MTPTSRRGLAAGTAVALALAALFPVFNHADWIPHVLGSVVVVVATGIVARRVRVPGLLLPLVELAAVAAYLVVLFAQGTFENWLPTGATVDALRALVEQGNKDINAYAPPVAPERGIVLIAAAGVGLVAVLVDVIAVTLDRAALAGLPLLALFAVPSAVLPGGLGSVPFAIGATGWLLLLLEEGSDRVGRWGNPLRTELPSGRIIADDSLAKVGRRIGAAALGCALVVPPLVPGLDERLIPGNGNGVANTDGDGPSEATTYNPITRLHGQLTLPKPRQLLVYTTDDPDPDYLRMTTLDRWTGSGWMASELQADRERARVQKGIARPAGEDKDAPHRKLTFRAAVDGGNLDVHWLPVPYGPTKVEVDGTWLWDSQSQTVFSASRTTKRLKPYVVTADRLLADREVLRAAGTTIDASITSTYRSPIQVPEGVGRLARRITRGLDSPYDKAVAIQRYFTDSRNGFVYDLRATTPGFGQTALEAFLEGKHGFCEQYASAMAALLRVVGIPSRVAVGFTPGSEVDASPGTYRVTTSEAHAWPEAWFQGAGWVRFEPTPAASGATTPDYSIPAAPTGPTPSASPTPAATASASPRANAFRNPDDLLREPSGTGTTGGGAGLRGPWLATAAVLAVLLATLPWLLTQWRRRRRVRLHDPLVAWDQLRDDVTDVGLAWRPAESPRTTAARLGDVLPRHDASHAALQRLASAVELTRFAPPGRAARADLGADTAAVRRGLRAATPRRVRLRSVVAPPSTLRWVSHWAGERVADVLDAVDQALSALGRPFRRVLRTRA